MGISMPVARLFLSIATVGLVIDCVRRRERFVVPSSAWALLALICVACVVTYFGINPDKGLGKIHKLLWYVAIPVTASLATTRERITTLFLSALYGFSIASLIVLVGNLVSAAAIASRLSGIPGVGAHSSFANELLWLGSITKGQVMMVATSFIFALFIIGCKSRVAIEFGDATKRRITLDFVALTLPIAALAEVVCLKRGSWIGLLVSMGLVAFRRVRARNVAIFVAALAAFALLVPAVRNRIANADFDSDVDGGGRLAMWTKIAPQMIAERPWGSGFRCLTTEKMREFCPGTEEGRDHLHSNFIEMTTSIGFEGLALYLLFLGLVVADCVRAGSLGLPVSAALVALMVNGFVEYSFADGEIIIIFGIMAGLVHSCARLERNK